MCIRDRMETALRARFAGAEYAVTNRQSGSDFLREMSSGVYLLLGYIFAAVSYTHLDVYKRQRSDRAGGTIK